METAGLSGILKLRGMIKKERNSGRESLIFVFQKIIFTFDPTNQIFFPF